MTTSTDLCNRALSEIGRGLSITTLGTDTTPAGVQCNIWYNVVRQQLLRAAPWAFARKTADLVELGRLTDDPPASPYPWLVKYTYPADCLRINYIMPPAAETGVAPPDVSSQPLYYTPEWMPSRAWRFLPAYDTDGATPRRVVLSNVVDAVAVYVVDVTTVDIMDVSFQNALCAALSYRLIMPLTGNVGMKEGFRKIAEDILTHARVHDGNEASPSVDHTPDWIAARGTGGAPVPWAGGLGMWYNGWESMGWGE